MNNVVYMFNCHNSTLTVKGKLNSVFLDSCRKSSVVFDNLVSSVEFVNCQSVQMQVCVTQSYFTSLQDIEPWMLFHLHTFMIEQCVCMCVLIIIHVALVYCPTCFMHFDFNPLVLELDIYVFAHHLCKMRIFYEPRRVTLGNTRHFVEE